MSAFQTLAGVKVDGIAGPVTRGKLVEKYFAASRQALLNGAPPPENGITLLKTEVVPHAAAAHFTLRQVTEAKKPPPDPSNETEGLAKPGTTPATESDSTAEAEPEARIDFMFFFPDAGPDPAPGAADGPEFLEWVKQTELQRAAVVGSAAGANTLFLELWDKERITRHKGAKYTLTGPETFSGTLVVGHTDTTGTPSVNDSLSLERAKATLAYLEDDVDTWLAFYGTSVPAERRWGETEDARMQELVNNPSFTRSELIAAYMALDGAELDANEVAINGTAHGCGENFPLDDSGEELDTKPSDGKEDALDRRVELFFFDPEFGVVPKPAGENSKKGSRQYPAWRKLAKVVSEEEVLLPQKWQVHLQFTDSDGNAVGAIEYRLETPDGVVIQGTHDSGLVHATLVSKSDFAILEIDGNRTRVVLNKELV